MRVRRNRPAIPDDWSGCPCEGIISEKDIRPIAGSPKIRMKLLIFDSSENLRKTWKELITHDEIGDAVGIVTGLSTECYRFHEDGSEDYYLSVDPKYFAIMGLCKEWLTAEVVCHECVHAGFAYHYRVGKKSPFTSPEMIEEEAVCYPSGHMFRMICNHLHDSGFW